MCRITLCWLFTTAVCNPILISLSVAVLVTWWPAWAPLSRPGILRAYSREHRLGLLSGQETRGVVMMFSHDYSSLILWKRRLRQQTFVLTRWKVFGVSKHIHVECPHPSIQWENHHQSDSDWWRFLLEFDFPGWSLETISGNIFETFKSTNKHTIKWRKQFVFP